MQQRRLKEMAEKAAKKAEAKKTVVNVNVDEFADDVKDGALQIIRPNMEKIDKKQVERVRRIAKAFEEKYQIEMMQGLEQPGRCSVVGACVVTRHSLNPPSLTGASY